MLSIRSLGKRYPGGTVGLADFSLEVGEGVLGLLGPNGAGKTTLMSILATVTKPTAGAFFWEGRDAGKDPLPLRRTLGYLPQDFGVYERLTAREFLRYLGRLKGLSGADLDRRVKELLELTNLHGAADRRLGGYSGGMRQRVGIAQALLGDPKLVIVDEPTVGLDPEERVRFRNLLSEIAQGRVVILSTHIVSDVEAVASEIAVMRQGRLVAHATPESLLSKASGRVFTAVVSSERLAETQKAVHVSNLIRRADGVHVRYVRQRQRRHAAGLAPGRARSRGRVPPHEPRGGVSAATLPLTAQIGAELKMRLRSLATPIAVVAFFAGAFFWIPDPAGKAVSITWDLADGRVQAPVYSAAYVGFALAILSGIFLAMGGFYLVAGSVRRDRERGLGAILAATPLSKTAYLGGKWAAHFAYLLVLDALALAAGLVAFLRYGVGKFDPVAFAGPYLLLTVPSIAVIAAIAVLFDVTPGLRGRGGLVLWFFVFLFGLVKLPLDLSGLDDEGAPFKATMMRPVYDPSGLATGQWLIRQTVPEAIKGVSTGHITRDKPIERVPWPGIRVTADLVAMRALNLALAVLPFALAVLIFDRFDPARGRRRLRKPGFVDRIGERLRRRRFAAVPDADGFSAAAVRLTPVAPNPTTKGAIFAEARLVWESASWIKWPMAASAMLAALLPGNFAQGAFLVLLVPVISEVAAREKQAGTRSLVFSQPAVPASPVLWKTAAVSLVVLMLGGPLAFKCFLVSPIRGLACLAGLAAVAGASVGFGSLSSGGKLFSGLYLVVWYMGLSGVPGADFTTALSKAPVPAYSFLYLGLAAVIVGAAVTRERLAEG